MGAEEEEEDTVARVSLGEVEIVAVEGGAGVCYDEVKGCLDGGGWCCRGGRARRGG